MGPHTIINVFTPGILPTVLLCAFSQSTLNFVLKRENTEYSFTNESKYLEQNSLKALTMKYQPHKYAYFQSAGMAENVPTPCLFTAYINMLVPDEIKRAFPIMRLLGKREEGGTL